MGESRASTRAARMRPQRCELIPGRFLITPARTNGSLPLEYRRCLHQSTGRAHPNRSAIARLTRHGLVPQWAFPQQYMPHQLAPRPSRNPCGVPAPCQCELGSPDKFVFRVTRRFGRCVRVVSPRWRGRETRKTDTTGSNCPGNRLGNRIGHKPSKHIRRLEY